MVTHPSGRLCRHPDRGILGINELPDLPGNPSTSRTEPLIRSPPRVTRTPRRPSHATAIADSSNTEENASALKELLGVQETVSKSRVVPTLQTSQISNILSGYLQYSRQPYHHGSIETVKHRDTHVVETATPTYLAPPTAHTETSTPAPVQGDTKHS